MAGFRNIINKAVSLVIAFVIAFALVPLTQTDAFAYTSSVTFTFNQNSISASASEGGFEITRTELAIKESGIYTVTGSCTNGNIVVKKGTTDVVLILKDLTLGCDYTAPVALNKSTVSTIYVSGTVFLSDNENPANETSNDTAVADAFEGAGIKVKSGSALTLEGDGVLNVNASQCKNGIKGAATADITVNMLSTSKLNITAANSGLASDGNLLIKGGNISIKSANEGIKSVPDDDDTASAGVVTITGGNIAVDTVSLSGGDGIQAKGGINILGGSFDIDAYGDAIHCRSDISIANGTFDLTTLNGYNSSNFNASTMSCKGIKASATDTDTENATNLIEITGGNFKINTPDDAVHSDGTATITGGTFEISTGDDGVHADTTLNLGSENSLARDPFITVKQSYEGLEAGTVNIYGGKYYVNASDDGINSAGGSDSNVPGGGFGGWKDHFNPGGNTGSGTYSLNIYGGSIYVMSGGDGLDSNGPLNLTGGAAEVWSASSGADSPLDADGTVTVNGATVFAAGAAGMGGIRPSGSQAYTTSSSRISVGSLVSVKSGSSAVYNTIAPKAVSYTFFSAPDVNSPAISSSNGSASCKIGSAHSHSFDSGVVTKAATETETGVITYTCTACGFSEGQTIPLKASADDVVIENNDEGYAVTFNLSNCSINVYYTQNYTKADETDATSAISRNSATGNPDSTGDGQINFTVIPKSGYTVDIVTATEGMYKNIKDVSEDAGLDFTYRITKITGALTVTVKTSVVSSDSTVATDATEITQPESNPDFVLPTDGAEVYPTLPDVDNTTAAGTIPSDSPENPVVTNPDSSLPAEPSESSVADENTTPNFTDSTSVTIPDLQGGYILGDADSNGKVTIKDVTLIQKVLAKFEGLSCNEKAAMTNDNSRLDIGDATLIQKYLAELLDNTLIGTFIKE